MPVRVGVAGATGRLGIVACDAARTAPQDLALVARFGRRDDGGSPPVATTLEAFFATPMDVVVDCTVYPISIDVVRAAIDAGVPAVVGASGWTDEDLVVVRDAAEDAGVPVLVVPNFALGAILMQRFAEAAARVFASAEIVELHHAQKRDAPSGTARATAARMQAAGALEVPIHSVRLPGLVAHQEVIFGGYGETLTIRHDSLSRDSFFAGIKLAIQAVRTQPGGLRSGLDHVLFPQAAAS